MNTTRIYWGRIVVCAVLLELVILGVSAPISALLGMTAFFVALPIASLVFAFLLGMVVGRKQVASRFVLHGTLVGIVATALYLGVCWAQFRSITPVIVVYGAVLFYLSIGLRIFGSVAGGFAQERRKTAQE